MGNALQLTSLGISAINHELGKGQSNDMYTSPIQEPYGDWGVQIPDQVDPRDCQRYPSSPYCGGSGLSPLPIGYEAAWKTTENEICLEVTPVVLFITGAPAYFCHKSSAPRQGKPANDVQKPLPPRPYLPPLNSDCTAFVSIGAYRLIVNSFVRYDPIVGDIWRGRAERFSGLFGEDPVSSTLDIAGFELESSSPVYPVGIYPLSGAVIRHSSYFRIYGDGGSSVPAYQLEVYALGFLSDPSFSRVDEILGIAFNDFKMPFAIVQVAPICPFPSQSYRPQPKSLPPTGQGTGDPPNMSCCEETNDLLRKVLSLVGGSRLPRIYSTGGVSQNKLITNIPDLIELFGREAVDSNGAKDYPITLPASLVDNTGDITMVKSTSEFLFWIVQQLDALIGEFPLKIKIKDINPLQAGDQEQVIEIPNLAEAMAEMYGLNIRNTMNGELALNFLTRLATEVVAIKNSSVTTQDYVKANASFLGYRGEAVGRKIQSAFDFTQSHDDLSKILNEVEVSVSGWKEAEKDNVLEYLQKLMFSAGIIKSAFFVSAKRQTKEFSKDVESLLGKKIEKEGDLAWENYLKLMNNDNSVFNKDQVTDVKIEELKLDDDYGGKAL